jgi:hypothetical protein
MCKEIVTQKNWEIQSDFTIQWKGVVLAKLRKGSSIREPKMQILPMEMLGQRQKKQLDLTIRGWFSQQIIDLYSVFQSPVDDLREIFYELKQGIGVVEKNKCPNNGRIKKWDRRVLAKYGIVCGHKFFYHPSVYRSKFQVIRFVLFSLWNELPSMPELPMADVAPQLKWPKGIAKQLGYYIYAGHVIRADMVDKIRWHLRKKINGFPIEIPKEPMSWLGCTPQQWNHILQAMGYAIQDEKIVSLR